MTFLDDIKKHRTGENLLDSLSSCPQSARAGL